jgi:HEAT repeat protein
VVGRRGPDAASAIPALLKLTADEDAGVRLVAVESLLYVDASRAELGRWLPVVETFVREKNPPVQSRAFSVLRALGPAATSLWPSMLEAMNESTGELRLQMALAWTRVNIEKHSTAFPILLEAVKTPTSPQLLDVVDTLGTLRKTAKEALPALRRILADDKRPPEFRWRLCLALVRIDRGEIAACLPVMQAILNKDQRRNYRLVDPILSLVEWGPDARSIGSDLRAIIGQEPVPERVALAAAITCVLIDGDQDEAARKFIRQVVEKPEEANERRELLYLLGRLGPRAKVFAPEVRALLKDPEHANEARQLLAKLES